MSWEPWKDVEKFVSDIGKSVEKAGSDVFKSVEKHGSDILKSDAAKIAIPIAAGAIGAPYLGATAFAGAATGAGLGYSVIAQEKAIEEAEELQEKQIAAQKELQEKQIELETLKMEEQKQLMDVFTKQDQPVYIAPRDIVTPAPVQAPVNYVLYIAIGIGILIYMGKIKL